MVRLLSVVLLVPLLVAPAAGQTAPKPDSWRIQDVSIGSNDRQLPGVEVSPNARLGVGMFGLKPEHASSRSFTVREIDSPRHRRAGVGFKLKF